MMAAKTCSLTVLGGVGGLLLSGCASTQTETGNFPPFEVRVEIDEVAFEIPAYKVTNNGSGMFWDSGCTQLVRIGDRLFASAFEHVEGCAPLNNARWALYERRDDGWHLCQRDEKDRTREPCPLAVNCNGRLLMSVNPTLAPWVDAPPDVSETKMARKGGDISHKWRGGPARPEFLEFDPEYPEQLPRHLLPEWKDNPNFTEHTYRTFTADGKNGEFMLCQNIGMTHSEWALLTRDGTWVTGQLPFPKRTTDPAYTPYHGKNARVNYPNVILKDRAVHFIGNSAYNIWNRIDPLQSETWGRANWGARFRKLHYAWTPDVTTTPFTEWTVVDETMEDGGTLMIGDSYLASDGRVHVVWIRNPIHPKLRDQYFPDIKRDRQLCYGILKDGKVLEKRVVASGGETSGPLWPEQQPRFHITPDHTIYIIYYQRGVTKETENLTGNYAVRVEPDGSLSAPVRIPFASPLRSTFFTATPRAGNALTDVADLLGSDTIDGKSVTRYVRLRFAPAETPTITIEGRGFVSPGEPRIVKLHADVRDPQNDRVSVEWRLPEGTMCKGKALNWRVPAPVTGRVPVEAVATDKTGRSCTARRIVSIPPPELCDLDGAVSIEAEAFTAQGGGEVKICNTVNASDTSISYWHKDIGHWLEWEFKAPANGKYEIWMRYTTACTSTRRSLLIDGQSPGQAFADIAIPTTGGWSGQEDQWAYMRLGPAIDLTAGTHRIRMTNLSDGLGVDGFILRPTP